MWDLVPGDIILAISLLVGFVAGVAVMAFLLKRSPKTIEGMSRADRFGAAFVAGGAVFVGTTALGNAIGTIAAALTPGDVTVYDLGRSVAEIEDDLMSLPGVVWASSTAVDVTISEAPASVTAWLLVADLLPIVLVLIVCMAAVWLAGGLLHGRPFARRFPIVLVVVASAVMVCGMFTQVAAGVGRAEAALFLNGVAGSGDEPFMLLSIAVDLSPLGWGLVIGLLAGAFQLGTRMQQDSKGLV